jgi:hypothetical protein
MRRPSNPVAEVELTLVTRDSPHCDEVEQGMEGRGYKVERVS